MAAKTLVLPTSDMSKMEEIMFLREIAASLKETSTFLADVFNQDFVDWVATRINADFSPDIYQTNLQLQHTREEEMKQAQMMIDDRDREIQNLNAKVESFILALAGKESIIQNCKDACEKSYAANSSLVDQRNAAEFETGQVRKTMAEQAQTIIELKAKLYDQMVGGKRG